MLETGGTVVSIGVYPNLSKPNINAKLPLLISYLQTNGVQVVLPADVAGSCGYQQLAYERSKMAEIITLAVTLGGDGTILHVARELAEAKIPVCGINMGNLGFLTAAESSEWQQALARLLKGDFLVDQRLLLNAVVRRDQRIIYSALALNDIVVSGSSRRLVRLNVHVDGELIAAYPADGFIVATPTGSTAYSLSAGGPVVSPHIEAILLTPICPHTLYSRSVLISRQETVEILPQADQGQIELTIDGQTVQTIYPGDSLMITEAACKASLIRFDDKSYYLTLHSKLRRGELDAGT